MTALFSSLREGRRSNTNVLSQFRTFFNAERIVCAPCGWLCRDVQYQIPPDAFYWVGRAHRLTVTRTHTHTHTQNQFCVPVAHNLTTTDDSLPTNWVSQLFRKLSFYGNPKDSRDVHKTPTVIHIVSQIYPIDVFLSSFFNINFWPYPVIHVLIYEDVCYLQVCRPKFCNAFFLYCVLHVQAISSLIWCD